MKSLNKKYALSGPKPFAHSAGMTPAKKTIEIPPPIIGGGKVIHQGRQRVIKRAACILSALSSR